MWFHTIDGLTILWRRNTARGYNDEYEEEEDVELVLIITVIEMIDRVTTFSPTSVGDKGEVEVGRGNALEEQDSDGHLI